MKRRRVFSSSAMWLALLLAGLTPVWAAGFPAPAFDVDHELSAETLVEGTRLHLGDRAQEARTTSADWLDLARVTDVPWEESDPDDRIVPLRVAIDPGHGGRDQGARSRFGLVEKNLCLRIAKLVRSELVREGHLRGVPVEILLTREKDEFLSLRERVRRANAWGADLFVSIHGNSAPVAKARGFEVYFLSAEATDRAATDLARLENQDEVAEPVKSDVLSILSDVRKHHHVEQSSRFAEVVFRAMADRLRSNGRGVRQAPFTVLAGTEMPALLVEVGYVTHEAEARLLSRRPYLKRLAGAISTGVIEFAERLGRRKAPSPPPVAPTAISLGTTR